MLKRPLVRLLAFGLVAAVFACEDVSVTQIAVAGLEVDPVAASIHPSQTMQLSATAFAASGAPLPGRTAEWTALDPDVATVNGSGLVQGVSVGASRIRATIDGQSATASVQVVPAPQIALSQSTVQLSATEGGSTTQPVTVEVTNGGGGSVTGLGSSIAWVEGPGGWLEATLSGTSTPTTISLRAAPGNLPLGRYEARVTVTPSGSGATPGTLMVIFQVSDPPPSIGLSAGAVGIASSEGESSPPPQTVSITNAGGGLLTGLNASISYASGSGTGWLTATLADTTAPTDLILRADPRGIAAGVYDAEVRITAAGSGQAAIVQVRYRFGEAPPALSVSPGSISRAVVEGASSLGPDTIRITNAGAGTLDGLTLSVEYSGSAHGWIDSHLSSSQAPAQLAVTMNPDGLSPGTYEARARIASSAAANSPATVLLRLQVEARSMGPSASNSTLSASPRTVNPDQPSTLLVQLRDDEGNALTMGGDEVFLTTSLGSLGSASGTTDHSGRFTTSLTSTSPGVAEVTAHLGSTASDPLIGSTTVTIGPSGGPEADAGQSTLEADPSRFTTDEGSEIGIQLRDADGDDFEVEGVNVFLVTTVGALDHTLGTSDGEGRIRTRLTSSVVGTGTVSAFLGTDAGGPSIGSVQITVDPGEVSAEGSTLEPTSAEYTEGEPIPIVVQLRDAEGNALATGGDGVFVTTTLGLLSVTSGTTDDSGRFTTSLTSNLPGIAVVTAYLGSGASDPLIGFTAVTIGPSGGSGADAGQSTLEADPSRFTTDEYSDIEIELRDADGDDFEVEGVNIFLVTTIGVLDDTLGISDDDGEFETRLRSSTVGTGTVTAYLGTDAGGPSIGSVQITVDPGEVSVEGSTIEATPAEITAWETSTIVVQLRDAAGNAVREEGEDIYLRASRGRLSRTSGETDSDGRFVATLQVNPSDVGMLTITAWLDDDGDDDDDRIGAVQVRVTR